MNTFLFNSLCALCLAASLLILNPTFPAERSITPEKRQVAVMVHQHICDGWSPANEKNGLLLASVGILKRYIHRFDELDIHSWRYSSGIYDALQNGLYISGETDLKKKWKPFIDADVYIEGKLNRASCDWQVAGPKGVFAKSIRDPFQHPKACAAELTKLVFKAAGTPLTSDALKSLNNPETQNPELFVQWSTYIGYRPTWVHHAPWDGARKVAKQIIKKDPKFRRGMAWAIAMMHKPNKVMMQKRIRPNAETYFEDALWPLDSAFYERVLPFFAEWLKKKQLLKKAAFPWVKMTLSMDTEGSGDSGLGGMPAIDMKSRGGGKGEKPKGERLRKHLCVAFGRAQTDQSIQMLKTVLKEDTSPSVRAAALKALADAKSSGLNALSQKALYQDKSPLVQATTLKVLAQKGALDKKAVAFAMKLKDPRPGLAAIQEINRSRLSKTTRKEFVRLALAGQKEQLRQEALWQALGLWPAKDAILKKAIKRALTKGTLNERVWALQKIQAEKAKAFKAGVESNLHHKNGLVVAAAAKALAVTHPDQLSHVISTLRKSDKGPASQKALAFCLAQSGGTHVTELEKLMRSHSVTLRAYVAGLIYPKLKDDPGARAQVMLMDPSFRVNLTALRMYKRLNNPGLKKAVMWSSKNHPNEYVRYHVLDHLWKEKASTVKNICLSHLKSPFWLLRMQAAHILAACAEKKDVSTIEKHLRTTENKWLRMALTDALHKAQGKAKPVRVKLGLGKRKHTEGGELPNGFQLWLGRLPKDKNRAKQLVKAGYRFGRRTDSIKIPMGGAIRKWNNSKGNRNTYLLRGVLDAADKFEKDLPYLYYIALFDEPCGPRGEDPRDNLRAFALATGQLDLLPLAQKAKRRKLPEGFPKKLKPAFEYFGAKHVGEISNWVTDMFRMTLQRKSPELRIFPQTISYMRRDTKDAFDIIDADGDYTWKYHRHNFMGDYAIGAYNRVINPGKPLCKVTWMGWWRPNIINGDKIFADTKFPKGPWRFRHYIGTRAALALYASGVEAGFFNHLGLGKMSEKKKKGGGNVKSVPTFTLTPWSKEAKAAVRELLDDPPYMKNLEGQLAKNLLKADKNDEGPGLSLDNEMGESLMEGGLEEKSPLERALEKKKQEMFERLMYGISYMNIFNTDATRSLSNLPLPDKSHRPSLVILGRDSNCCSDGEAMPMPAMALLAGFDLAPTYDCVRHANFMRYDTILLKGSRQGVTPDLVNKINHWLKRKKNGLLIVSDKITGKEVLFPRLTHYKQGPLFLWEKDLQTKRMPLKKETYTVRRRRKRTRWRPPHISTFVLKKSGTRVQDKSTRLAASFEGKIDPLVITRDKRIVLGRWRGHKRNVVLFEGAAYAGPAYTSALEKIVLALDKERGAKIKRNPYWGHVIYETKAFVVDVATRGYKALLKARPRKHRGVDIITGAINPEVRTNACALILKDYVGPYAGGKGNWAVMARHALKKMELKGPKRLMVQAEGVTRVSHIGKAPLVIESPKGLVQVQDQIQVWKKMREGRAAFCIKEIPHGRELHVYSEKTLIIKAR